MKKTIGLFVVTLGIFAFTAFASASTADILQPAGGGTTNLESLRIGTAGSGGVTFFNGSILNEGADTPLTVADDLRVDGAIWRGETAGPGGSMPIKLNDDVRVYGDLTVDGSLAVGSDLVAEGNITATNEDKTGYVRTDYVHNTVLDAVPDVSECNEESELGKTIIYRANATTVSFGWCLETGGAIGWVTPSP